MKLTNAQKYALRRLKAEGTIPVGKSDPYMLQILFQLRDKGLADIAMLVARWTLTDAGARAVNSL